MFSKLYQTSTKSVFLEQVKNTIAKDLIKIYRAAFISPWWRMMFKITFEKYIERLINSYQSSFPKLDMKKILSPAEHLLTKQEWLNYLHLQAALLANAVFKAESRVNILLQNTCVIPMARQQHLAPPC
jgi:murein L,D-transpeptidase YafK